MTENKDVVNVQTCFTMSLELPGISFEKLFACDEMPSKENQRKTKCSTTQSYCVLRIKLVVMSTKKNALNFSFTSLNTSF